jgi:hypothetical protein
MGERLIRINAVTIPAARKRIVELLVEHEALFFGGVHEEKIGHLSEQLGLAPTLLREVAMLSRFAHVNDNVGNIGIPIRSPISMRGYVLAAGKKNGFSVGDYTTFFRSLLHTLMQTTFEPKRRSHGRHRCDISTDPHPLGHRLRPLPISLARWNKNQTMKCDFQRVRITRGLHGALRARARNFGTTTSSYCFHWLLDAIDDLLPKSIVLEPVVFSDLFPRADNYVLPAKKPLPETPRSDSSTMERTST